MKLKLLILSFSLLMLNASSFAAHLKPEKYYQTIWCNANNGVMEYKLKDKTRVDCLTSKYAVEFDFGTKWAESIGQSLYYAQMTNKIPAIGLILEQPSDYKYYSRILHLCKNLGIELFPIN